MGFGVETRHLRSPEYHNFQPWIFKVAVKLSAFSRIAAQHALRTPHSILALRLQFGVPVKEVHPAFVQMVWWEFPAHVQKFLRTGWARRFAQRHAALAQAFRSFAQVAGRAGSDHVLPTCDPARRTRHNVIKGQIALGSAILAPEFVPQK